MIKLTDNAKNLLDELKRYSSENYYHSVRVKAYTKFFLDVMIEDKAAEYSPNEIDAILMGALLHDIGKIHVRNFILTKKGKLTNDEFSDIAEHARIGAETATKGLHGKDANIVKNICMYHHERIDGKGYYKLTKIPLYVQVVSICDAFDAMTSERSYKKGMSHGEAIALIEQDKCGKFSDVMIKYLKIMSDRSKGN